MSKFNTQSLDKAVEGTLVDILFRRWGLFYGGSSTPTFLNSVPNSLLVCYHQDVFTMDGFNECNVHFSRSVVLSDIIMLLSNVCILQGM